MRKSTVFLLLMLFTLPAYLFSQSQVISEINPTYATEIKKLSEDAKIKAAFDLILKDDQRTVAEHILLTEIPAPPFKEMERAKEFKKMLFKETGLDSIWIDKVGNVVAFKKGKVGKRTVALDAHLDTVFPEGTDVKVKMRGDTLYAPGISDDTRGLAMVLAIARAIHKTGIETAANQLYVGSVGEEGLGDLRGVKHLFSKEGPSIDAWISIDGGTIGRVNNQGLGSYRYKVSFHGPGGHSWGAFGLGNPHHALGAAIQHFVQAADRFTASGPKTSYNVGRIGGGTSVNSIPFISWMEIDTRSILPARLDSLERILRTAVDKALQEQNALIRLGEPLTVTVEKIGNRPSGSMAKESPIIQRAIAATAYFGKRPSLTIGSTNSNIPFSLGIPAVTIGRGGKGRNAHSLHEWWINEEGHRATQMALLMFIAECEGD